MTANLVHGVLDTAVVLESVRSCLIVLSRYISRENSRTTRGMITHFQSLIKCFPSFLQRKHSWLCRTDETTSEMEGNVRSADGYELDDWCIMNKTGCLCGGRTQENTLSLLRPYETARACKSAEQ